MLTAIWFSAIVSSIGVFVLAVLTLRFNSTSKVNRLFALYCMGQVGWLMSAAFVFQFSEFFFVRLMMVFVSLSLLILLTFVQEFTGFLKSRVFTGAYYLIGFCFVFLLLTPYIFPTQDIPNGFMSGSPGPLLPVYGVWLIGMIIVSFSVLLYAGKKHTDSLRRVQSQYVALGVVVSLGLPWFFNYYLVNYHDIFVFYPLGMLAQTALVGFIAYAILRHRLLDIHVLIKRGALLVGAYVLSVGVFFMVAWFFLSQVDSVSGTSGLLLITAVFAASLLAHVLLWPFLRRILYRVFPKSIIDPHQFTEEEEHIVQKTTGVDDFVEPFMKALFSTVQLQPVHLYIYENITSSFRLVVPRSQQHYESVEATWLKEAAVLSADGHALVEGAAVTGRELNKRMQKHSASTLLLLQYNNRLLGVVFLGDLVDGGVLSDKQKDNLKRLGDEYQLLLWYMLQLEHVVKRHLAGLGNKFKF